MGEHARFHQTGNVVFETRLMALLGSTCAPLVSLGCGRVSRGPDNLPIGRYDPLPPFFMESAFLSSAVGELLALIEVAMAALT